MILYRLGNFFYKKRIPILPSLFNAVIRLVHNSAVYSETEIGKGTVFGYGGIGVVIHKRSVIGQDCLVGTNVTIGGRSKSEGVPVIGDRVYISTGAKVLGEITIGNDVVIGANAVVINDIPSNCVVVGMPAKITRREINPKDFY